MAVRIRPNTASERRGAHRPSLSPVLAVAQRHGYGYCYPYPHGKFYGDAEAFGGALRVDRIKFRHACASYNGAASPCCSVGE